MTTPMGHVRLVVLVLLISEGLKCKDDFQMSRVPAIENKTIPGIIYQQIRTRSALECAVVCHNSKQCETMRYNSISSLCTIIRNETQEVINVDGELGEAFKQRKSSSSKCSEEGYQYIWELDVCYKFNFEEKLMWLEAETKCENKGGHLASFEYSIKEIIMFRYLQAIKEATGRWYHWWIGLSDVVDEGNFTWVTGQPLNAYKNWNKNQPDNDGNFLPGFPANCALMLYETSLNKFVWFDQHCNQRLRYICENEIFL